MADKKIKQIAMLVDLMKDDGLCEQTEISEELIVRTGIDKKVIQMSMLVDIMKNDHCELSEIIMLKKIKFDLAKSELANFKFQLDMKRNYVSLHIKRHQYSYGVLTNQIFKLLPKIEKKEEEVQYLCTQYECLKEWREKLWNGMRVVQHKLFKEEKYCTKDIDSLYMWL